MTAGWMNDEWGIEGKEGKEGKGKIKIEGGRRGI
jgi:hypothetical protein